MQVLGPILRESLLGVVLRNFSEYSKVGTYYILSCLIGCSFPLPLLSSVRSRTRHLTSHFLQVQSPCFTLLPFPSRTRTSSTCFLLGLGWYLDVWVGCPVYSKSESKQGSPLKDPGRAGLQLSRATAQRDPGPSPALWSRWHPEGRPFGMVDRALAGSEQSRV